MTAQLLDDCRISSGKEPTSAGFHSSPERPPGDPVTSALVTSAVALLILVLPGAAVTAVLRLRGLVAVALTPVLSVSIIAVSAIVGPFLGMTWGWEVPALGTVVVVLALLLVTRPYRDKGHVHRGTGDDRRALVWGLVGAGVAAVFITSRVLIAASSLESFTQNYDTVFHLNAVHYALENGDASSMTIADFTQPGSDGAAPYPGAWHAVVTLVVMLSGAGIPLATNVVWLAAAGLVWPTATLFLTRILVGPRPVVLAAAGVLTSAFAAFPYLLLYYGSLYPNTLAYAFLPTGVALTMVVLREARSPLVERGTAILLSVLYLPAQILSQPNGLFSVVFLLTPLLVLLLMSWIRSGFRSGRVGGGLRIGLTLLLVISVLTALLTNSRFRSLFFWAHPKSMPFGEALWRAATQFPLPTWVPAPVLTALVLYGLYLLARYDRRHWMIVGFLLTTLVYGLAVGSQNEVGNALIVPWYGNPDRLAALMPIFGVPLAAVGVEKIISVVQHRSRRDVPGPVLALAATALVAIASPTLWQMNFSLAERFEVPTTPDSSKQLDADELALLRQLEDLVPEDTVLANNPWNGSALAVALTDRDVLFPYMSLGDLGEDRELLRSSLDEIARNQEVCAAAERLGVRYLLDFGTDLTEQSEIAGTRTYPGIDRASRSDAFETVARTGNARLLELPPCTVAGTEATPS